MFNKRTMLPVASTFTATFMLLSACTSSGSGDDSDGGDGSSGNDGFSDVSNQMGAWDMCKVLPIDPILGQVSADTYINEPHHVGLGSAMNAEAISCAGDIDSIDTSGESRMMSVIFSVLPGTSTEHVDDMWALRQEGWYEDNVGNEDSASDLDEDDLYIDEDIEGEWDEGHAYVLLGTEGEVAGAAGSMIINVRTDNYIVEAWVTIPQDFDKYQAASFGLSEEEVEAATSLEWSRTEFADWMVDEHISTMFESVSSALEDDSEVQR